MLSGSTCRTGRRRWVSIRWNVFPPTSASWPPLVSSTRIDTSVPAGASSGRISVSTPIGSASSATDFTVTPAPPTITSFAPASGPVGTGVVDTEHGGDHVDQTDVRAEGDLDLASVADGRDEAAPEDRVMNMRWPPRVVVITPWIRAGFDSGELVAAFGIG